MGGVVAVQEVLEVQMIEPAVPPKLTLVEPTTKPVPVTAMTVPPPTGPRPGLSELMVGTL